MQLNGLNQLALGVTERNPWSERLVDEAVADTRRLDDSILDLHEELQRVDQLIRVLEWLSASPECRAKG